jgi:hypothetical protein
MKLEIEVDDTTGQPKDFPDAIKKHVDGLVTAGVDKGFKPATPNSARNSKRI